MQLRYFIPRPLGKRVSRSDGRRAKILQSFTAPIITARSCYAEIIRDSGVNNNCSRNKLHRRVLSERMGCKTLKQVQGDMSEFTRLYVEAYMLLVNEACGGFASLLTPSGFGLE